jgi:tetratricopeptide (TPR) repeat protein
VSVFAKAVDNATRPIFSVRYEQNLHFTGRDDFLRRLAQELSERKPKRYNHRVALYGLGGVGKTQIALEYAYRHKNDYTYVFWISAADQPQLLSGFGEIATVTGCVRSEDDPNQLAKAVLRWLEVTEGWLCIIDNLDDITVIDGYLPTTIGVGHTLITTRNTHSAGIPAAGMEVMVMNVDNSVRLLLDGIQIEITDEIRFEARKIVEALGFLPLAIEQAAGYIRISQNVEEYLDAYTKQRHEILNWRPTRNHAYNDTVGTTWKMSLERLRTSCPNSIILVQFLVFQNPDEILLEFLRAGAEAVNPELRQIIENNLLLRESLAALESYSLIRVSRGQKIRIHRLVQAIIQDDMESELRLRVISDVIQLGLRSFPAISDISDQSQREICRRYRWQVAACLENTGDMVKGNPEWMALIDVLAEYLLKDGFYLDGLQWVTMTAEIRKKTLGSQHESTLKNMTKMGLFFRHLGRTKEAAELNEETLEIMKRVLGLEHQETLTTMNNLAVAYLHLGKYREAAMLNEETAELRERLLGLEHQKTLISMNNLAVSYNYLGRYEKALGLIEKTVEIRKRVSGLKHQETLISLKNLGRAYRNMSRVEEVTRLFEEIMKLGRNFLGEEHPQMLVNLEELARSLNMMGQLKKAIELHRKTLEIRKRVWGFNHPHTLSSMDGLAGSLHEFGCTKEALLLHKETLKIRQSVLPAEHPEIFESMEGLADSLWSLDQKQEARQLYQVTLTARTRILGEDHPATLRVTQRFTSKSGMPGKA